MGKREDITGIIERINVLRMNKLITAKDIAEMAGLQREAIQRQLTYQYPLSYKVPWAVLTILPSISPSWLMLGQEPMYKMPILSEDAQAIMGKLNSIERYLMKT